MIDKQSIYELQKIDCNCSDCGYMVRDFDRFKNSLTLHEKWQKDYFEVIKKKMLDKAKVWEKEGEPDKAKNLIKEANSMRFQFNKSTASINFGTCSKFNKPVSFIPNTCQLDTQECFQHRKDVKHEEILS